MFSPSRRRSALFALAMGLAAGCDGTEMDKVDPEAAPGAAEVVADAKEDAEQEGEEAKAAKDADADADKGTAELTLGDGGEVWKAKRASAKLKEDGTLRISASVQSISDERTSRRQLTLYVTDYKGPGKYVITSMSSNLTTMSLDLKKIKAAEAEDDKAKSDKAATEAAVDGFKGSSVMLLKGAKVEITKADDDFIDGSMTWSGVAMNGPGKLSGTFHARVKK